MSEDRERVAGEETGEQGSGRKRVIVVEDGAVFRAAMIRLLDAEGFEVEAYADADAALTRIGEDPARRFDLLITDVVMPGMTGLEMVKRVRELAEQPPPVIYMSGEVRPALNDAAGKISGDVILAKPFTPEELIEALEQALS